MQRLLLTGCLGAFLFAASVFQTRVATAETSNGEILPLICDAPNIEGTQCKRAKGYPGGKACNVDLDRGTRIEGHYLSADTTILLVVYESDCEPHATNNGGSLVFERRGSSLAFKGYQPGLVVTDCTSVAKGTRQDRLVCTTGYMGQGQAVSTVSEVVFTQDFSKKVKTSLDVLVTATDDSGAYGVNRVECKKTFRLFSLSSPTPGPTPDTVLVEATYADANVIRKACAPGVKQPKDALEPAPAGEAYIEEDNILKGRFVIDLATRKIGSEPVSTGK